MPYLPAQYISSWYYLYDSVPLSIVNNNTQYIRLFESFSQTQINDINPVQYLQGDIGTRVMDVQGIYWKTDVQSKSIITQTLSSTQTTGIFDLIVGMFEAQRNPNTQRYLTYLMESANVSVTDSGVSSSLSLISDSPNAFIISPYQRTQELDFIGRVAKQYDTVLNISFLDTNSFITTTAFQIIDAKLNVSFDIQKHYFIGHGQKPHFSIQGVHTNGSCTILVTPEEFNNFFIQEQTSCALATRSFTTTTLQICDSALSLGAFSMIKNIKHSMQAGQLTQVSFDFENYTPYNGSII